MESLAKVKSDNNILVRQQVLENSINPDVVADRLDAGAQFASDIAETMSAGGIVTYNKFTDIGTTGPNTLVFCLEDDSEDGNGAEGAIARINNKLFQIVIVEIS